MKKLRDGKKCSWMTKKVRNLLNRKQRCFRLVKICASEENVKQLKVIERKCKNAIRNVNEIIHGVGGLIGLEASLPSTAFWLWLRIVSVLIRVTTDMSPTSLGVTGNWSGE